MNLLMFAILPITLLGLYGIGLLILKWLQGAWSRLLAIPLGFAVFLGIQQFLIYFFVIWKIPSKSYFVFLTLLLFVGMIYALKSFFTVESRVKQINLKIVAFAILYVVIMVFIISNRTLGENTFDTVHYLSMITEGANNVHFGWIDYGTGWPSASVNVQYDFQSFYAFGSYLVFMTDGLLRFLTPDYLSISTHVAIWTLTIIYNISLFGIVLTTLELLKHRYNNRGYFSMILVLGFFANLYFNNVYAFYGNTHRTLTIGLMMLMFFELYKNGEQSLKMPVIIMILSSALISTSSSGFFIGAMLISIFTLLMFKEEKVQKPIILSIGIMFLPTLVFAFFYLWLLNLFSIVHMIIFLALFISILTFELFIFKRVNQKWIFYILLSVSITIVYVLSWFQKTQIGPSFFADHRYYDMVWNHINFLEIKASFINLSVLIGLFCLLLKNHTMRLYLLIAFVLFVNPLSSIFVARYMASVVYYRYFDLIFNPYLYILFGFELYTIIKNRWIKWTLISVVSLFAILQALNYYHYSFVPSEKFNPIFRIEGEQVPILSELKNRIELEKYEKAMIVSQIEEVRSFVPNIITPISNQIIRNLDKDQIVDEISQMLNIFVVRDFTGQKVFNQEPAYEATCQLLIDNRIEFIIVDRTQFYYSDTNEFIPLEFRVRDCATEILSNDHYALYQMYWK